MKPRINVVTSVLRHRRSGALSPPGRRPLPRFCPCPVIRLLGGVFAPYLLLITRRLLKVVDRCWGNTRDIFPTRLGLSGRWYLVLFDLTRVDALRLLFCHFRFRVCLLVCLVLWLSNFLCCFSLVWFDVSVPTSMIPCMVIRTRNFYFVGFMESLLRCSGGSCGSMVYVWW